MDITLNNKIFPIAEMYQPLYNITVTEKMSRGCSDRWKTIIQAEEGYNNSQMFEGEIVDWGCSLGWFSFQMAERSYNKIYAIDWDLNNINVCKELQQISKHDNINFIHGKVPLDVPDNIKSHIILSVLHHTQQYVLIPNDTLDKLKNAKIIYMELAHCNEWPSWSNNLKPDIADFISPFHYLKRTLEIQFPNFMVRLIGAHNTHIGSVRPIFQLKAYISEPITTELFTGSIIDKFILPYIDFGDFSLNENDNLLHKKRYKDGISYAIALDLNNNKYFLKFKDSQLVKKSEFIDGFLLSNIIKFGLLPYYDRHKLKRQLAHYNFSNHKDPHPWNFFVGIDSNLIPIDYDAETTSLDEKNVNVYIQTLIQLI